MGTIMEIRKVQVTGGNSFIVSLPKVWVNQVGLRPKDAVAIMTQSDDSLLIIPSRDLRSAQRSEATVELPKDADLDSGLRLFIAHYLAGYEVIRLVFGKLDPAVRSAIRDGIRKKLIGVEIIEESSTQVLTQCLSGYVDLPLKKALERMSVIAAGMVADATDVLEKGDRGLADEVIRRDDEVDRFYHFILRQLNIAVRDRSVINEIGLSSARDCLGYRLAAKSVERIGDHATSIAEQASGVIGVPESWSKKIRELALPSVKAFESSISALVRLDTGLANSTISDTIELVRTEQRLSGEMLAPRMSATQVASMKLILESVRRVAEYATDISEIVLDLSVKEPSPSR
jgi:phosphate uptake regulator